jgi:hypothetical protein
LDEDVQEIVEGAREIGQWRTYVRSYPWVCLGAALAMGYLIVPRRSLGKQPDARTLAELANQSRLLATSHLPSNGGAGGRLRSQVRSAFTSRLFTNIWLWAAVVICLILQAVAVYMPLLQRVLHTVPPTVADWGVIFACSLMAVLVVELVKVIQPAPTKSVLS